MSALKQMDDSSLQQLVAEVKETVATHVDLKKPEKSSIKMVDLWKIERNKKSATRSFAQKRNYIPFI
ncbi:MAG: hypothetical protein JST47_10170 [Bacteroidetes bacterium]|nr:hypothetical protein [Bacteroidota bacterium]